MSAAAERREYEAMIAFEDAVARLREHGWTRDQVTDRCDEANDSYDEDAAAEDAE